MLQITRIINKTFFHHNERLTSRHTSYNLIHISRNVKQNIRICGPILCCNVAAYQVGPIWAFVRKSVILAFQNLIASFSIPLVWVNRYFVTNYTYYKQDVFSSQRTFDGILHIIWYIYLAMVKKPKINDCVQIWIDHIRWGSSQPFVKKSTQSPIGAIVFELRMNKPECTTLVGVDIDSSYNVKMN